MGRISGPPRRDEPGQTGRTGRRHVLRHGRAVRGGRGRGGGGVRDDPQDARLREERGAPSHRCRHRIAARGDRSTDRDRVGQARSRRLGRGRPGRAHLQDRGRGGRTHRRRGDPARPEPRIPKPDRHHPPLSDRPHRGRQPVQLPAEPGRSQAGAGDRFGQSDRAEAAVQGPADDADRGGVHRRSGPSARSGEHPADDSRARRPDGLGRSLQAADVHRQPRRGLEDEGAGREEEGRARTGRQRRRRRRSFRRPRLGGPAHPRRRLQLRRPGLHQRPAPVRPRGRVGRVHGPLRRRRAEASSRRPARPADRRRPHGRPRRRRTHPGVGGRGPLDGRARCSWGERPTARTSRRRY